MSESVSILAITLLLALLVIDRAVRYQPALAAAAKTIPAAVREIMGKEPA